MVLDYGTIKYIETVGSSLRLHYIDTKKVDAYPDGRGRYLPRKTTTGAPPDPDPREPPEEPEDPPPPAPGTWTHPLAGSVLTSGFGWRSGGFHYGVDLSTTTAGTYVKGHSTDGAYTFTYNHGADETLAVEAGTTVPAGTILFYEGATGNVTGTHLHFEIIEGVWNDPWAPPYNNGANFIDPLPVLRDHGVLI